MFTTSAMVTCETAPAETFAAAPSSGAGQFVAIRRPYRNAVCLGEPDDGRQPMLVGCLRTCRHGELGHAFRAQRFEDGVDAVDLHNEIRTTAHHEETKRHEGHEESVVPGILVPFVFLRDFVTSRTS